MLISSLREALCLDFANTLSWRGRQTPTEALHHLADLLAWIERSAGVDRAATQEIRKWARDYAGLAARIFAEAIAMREVIFRIFSAVGAGDPIGEADFVALKNALAKAPERNHLARSGGSYAWRIAQLRPSAEDILAPVLWSAGDLLLNAEHRRIRQCANEQCLWLFVDGSKNGTRRWCDMASCGNRAKARRHYSKIRQH